MKLDGNSIDLAQLWEVSQGQKKLELDPKARELMKQSRTYIEKRLSSGEVIYGVNTGFGALSSVRINESQISELQKNLVRSHSVGIGEPFSVSEGRAILCLRANALARGHSGVRPDLVDKILEFLNHDVIPVIPGQGSVGASGDLAPLAHVALSLMGEGEVFYSGSRMATAEALKKAGIKPIELQAKEGLALINGCQVMTAVGLTTAFEIRRLCWLTDLAGAMSLEASRGSRQAFDPLISGSRPHQGEAKTARNLLKLLSAETEISKSHADCDRIQDAYSFRCMPQVHGATKDTLRYVIKVLETEANSSTDNPLVFSNEGKILSGGNFHGEPVAFALDFLAIAVAAQANISECRIEKLINPSMSGGLPAFLTKDGGLNSGMMIVQVAAASLVSENKILAHPASVDSIPTSADKEDHVSMGTIAARKLTQIARNAENVCAMELLSANQGLDLLSPLKSSKVLQKIQSKLREVVPPIKSDRAFYKDIDALRALIRSNELIKILTQEVGELEW
ncbi:MAG: histidine ammonia-lyase [Oligoflexia bacterium]|nr:histidine ammonia-lyase [Oligoflexia bacterium]